MKKKPKGATMEFSRERMDDLMTAYDKYIAQSPHILMTDVYRSIVNMPAQRFWVSSTRASVVISAIMRGEQVLKNMFPLKREMYEEIYRRAMVIRARQPRLSVLELCDLVVVQSAPKFYLTPGSAKIMVCKARKEWIRRKLAKLRLSHSRR